MSKEEENEKDEFGSEEQNKTKEEGRRKGSYMKYEKKNEKKCVAQITSCAHNTFTFRCRVQACACVSMGLGGWVGTELARGAQPCVLLCGLPDSQPGCRWHTVSALCSAGALTRTIGHVGAQEHAHTHTRGLTNTCIACACVSLMKEFVFI